MVRSFPVDPTLPARINVEIAVQKNIFCSCMPRQAGCPLGGSLVVKGFVRADRLRGFYENSPPGTDASRRNGQVSQGMCLERLKF